MSQHAELIERLGTHVQDQIMHPDVRADIRAASTALAAVVEERDALAAEVAKLQGIACGLADLPHPHWRSEDDIDALYENEKALGLYIDKARAVVVKDDGEATRAAHSLLSPGSRFKTDDEIRAALAQEPRND